MWCACGVHVMCMWCACGVHVVCMWCACGVHVVCMWCACGVHVGEEMGGDNGNTMFSKAFNGKVFLSD